METYDVVVIGAGPGGYVAAVRAAQLGLKTACVEKEKTVGGTCLNVGCIPSKTLLHASEQFYFVKKESEEFGVDFSGVTFDLAKMMRKKEEVVDSLVKSVEAQFKQHKVDWIKGSAQFTSPNTIKVNNQEITAKNFILATGSEPIALPFAPFDEKLIVSSTGALSLKVVPKEMVVIGAGVIGVELASVYSRLGSKVTIVEMLDRITPTVDDTIGRALMQSLKRQGLTFHLSSKVTGIELKSGAAVVSVETPNEKLSLSANVVLVAVGRRPFSKDLGLEALGIEKNPQGFVQINSNFQTKHAHIYAIGDLVDGPMLAHKASDEGTVVAEIIAGKKAEVHYITIPNVVYTNPEVAAVGLTEKEAKDLGLAVRIGTAYFKGNARARCSGYKEGLVKVVGESKAGRLLGIHIFGPHASEMIGEGVLALQKKMTVEELARASHAHPTLAEAIKDACMMYQYPV
jgi:dihydrolipoamide dehydrogenase